MAQLLEDFNGLSTPGPAASIWLGFSSPNGEGWPWHDKMESRDMLSCSWWADLLQETAKCRNIARARARPRALHSAEHAYIQVHKPKM